MHSNCIKDLLNLKGVILKSIKNLENSVEIYIELPIKEHTCPCCGTKTTKVHDYYTQPNLDSISNICKKTNVDPGYISRMLPYLAVTNTHLPRVLCIDEFKGNAGHYKYQVALNDGETHDVVDILECRHKHSLCEYFKKFPKEQLDNVKYFVTDLWETYKDISFTYFRKAKVIADHFHWARYACDVVNTIRIEVQKNLPAKERRYFKHSRKLLLSRACNIKKDKQSSRVENFIR